ncbi:MAG: TolC family protein [Desulfobacterales bacterium]
MRYARQLKGFWWGALAAWLVITTIGRSGAAEIGSAAPAGAALVGLEVLDLAAAKGIAVAGSPSLAAAVERVRQAEERVRQARAAYWPFLDLGGSAVRSELSDNAARSRLVVGPSFDPNAALADPETFYRAELTAGWTLFSGFRRWYENARARFGEMQSRSALDEARRLLVVSVAGSYYAAQLAREDLTIARADEDFNLRQTEEARARRRAGSGSLSDVLNFEVQVNAARSAINDAERQYTLARIGLAVLMGLPEAVIPEALELAALPTESPADLALPDAGPLVGFAENHRPDLMEGAYRLRQAAAGIGVARSDFFPDLSLQAALDGLRENSGRFEGDDFGNSIGVYMTYNLFAGGATRARVAEARAGKREAERNLAALRISVASEVREALANLQASQRELRLQQQNAALVQQNRDLVEKEYAAGQASLVRLNEAQRNLTQARSRLALARVALRQSWERLEAATGRNLADVGTAGSADTR